MSNQLIGLIILIFGIVVGWLFNDLYNSVRKRKVSGIIFQIVKKRNPTVKEVADALKKSKVTPVDAEYVDGKFKFAK